MKMRKLISLVLALVMVLGLAAPVMAAEESVQETAGGRLLSLGVIEGYTDGTLGLDKTITRAEIAVVLARIAGMGEAADLLKDTPSKFSDVKTGEWYTGWINLASSQGWVVGDPQGTFRPNDSISYREIVTVLLKVLGYDDNLPGDWPTNFLAKAASLGITKGIVSDSKAPAVRGDVFVMTSRTLDEETVKYDKDTGKFEESGKTLLVDKMDLKKAEGVVTSIPR
ncbi:MAG TPA: S-layer homology domain-containing protein, partial [Clostridia bacterium]|nr:S-layer homology domain-containing protein [Clostridia bacterium]